MQPYCLWWAKGGKNLSFECKFVTKKVFKFANKNDNDSDSNSDSDNNNLNSAISINFLQKGFGCLSLMMNLFL